MILIVREKGEETAMWNQYILRHKCSNLYYEN